MFVIKSHLVAGDNFSKLGDVLFEIFDEYILLFNVK